ncbi:ER membrane protein complex subunit 1-like [Gigantopelta aegis]|uniref:ER membrane protein complex subunit 1-like n=1 Tax=Gigantopelta aegis TaxID=1735272 RepID=UPI001B88DD96|nr:ER membrane protein complex subunit 1-like [Gigantopelta aegis]
MAATWLYVVCFAHLILQICATYEDQAGKFDWKQSYVGRVEHLHWDQSAAYSGKRFLVATDKHVIASIHAHNGSLVWRKVFEQSVRGRVDCLLHQGNLLFSVHSGGSLVRGWYSGSGNMMWEVMLQSHLSTKPSAVLVGKNKAEKVIVATAHGLYALQSNDGKRLWDVDLLHSDTVAHWFMVNRDHDVLLVGVSPGSKVTVVKVDHEGKKVTEYLVPAMWITEKTSCLILGQSHFLCYEDASLRFQLLQLREDKLFASTPLQSLGLKPTTDSSLQQGLPRSNTLEPLLEAVFRVARDHVAVLQISESNIKVLRDLPESSAAQIVTYDDMDILQTVQVNGSEFLTISAYNLKTEEELVDLVQTHSFPHSYGLPQEIFSLVFARKKDHRLGCKIVLLGEDFCIHYKSGKSWWHREESLAYISAVEMVDLPVSENQAKFEDEFGSREGDVAAMFYKRILTQLSQLQTFFENIIHKLQGPRHQHAPMMDDDEDVDDEEDEDDEDLTRDEFNLHKIIVVVTEAGKIFGIRSHTGRIIWRQYLPDLCPFDRYGRHKMLLYVQRTTAHFPHPPQCVVLGKNKKTGNGMLYAFDPIAGTPEADIFPGGMDIGFEVFQLALMSEVNEEFLKGLIIVGNDLKIRTYPESVKSVVKKLAPKLFLHLTNVDTGTMTGYRVLVNDHEGIKADPMWNIDLQEQYQKVTNVISKRVDEHVHSQGRVLGDRSVLYKYLNPNLVVVTTEGEEPGSAQSHKGPVNYFNVYLIDAVTGHIVFHLNHKRAKGPVVVVHSENWVVYSFINEKHRRPEIAVLEMFEGKEQSNSTAFTSFSPPPQPLILRQSYIFPLPIYTIAATITEKGITSKNLIIALKVGGLLSLPKALLDPRRPVIPTQETMEEGTIPYIPEIPINTEAILNYNQSVFNIDGIHTAPAGLESTSLVLAYGIDLYYCQVTPSKMFDVLKEDFDFFFIGLVLVLMIIVSVVSQKFAARKALNRAWK